MTTFTHDTFISPFTWRYGSSEMRSLFSERHKRILLRKVWIALAESEAEAGLVTASQVAELKEHAEEIDIDTATRWEEELHHDLMAEIKTYAGQCPKAGAIIHLGATSMDIEDNADAIRLTEAMDEIIKKTKALLTVFIDKMEQYADTPCMAFTHIQPAEPTTIGYRFAQTAQDMIHDLKDLERVRSEIKGKGMKGAVGTAASYQELLKGTGMTAEEMEDHIMRKLGITAFTASTQVYPRKQDLRIGEAISNLACTISRFAFDFRLLMSPPIGEWSEPFGKKQVGSSAMPFKRNPINSEKIDSLARYNASQVEILWQNNAGMLLERTLDDSANRRLVLPSLFLSMDEILITETKVVSGMTIHMNAVERNLRTYGIFASSERLLMELGRSGADRQAMHEVIRENSLKAWDDVQSGKENPLQELLVTDKRILAYLDKDKIASFLHADDYIGDAPKRTRMVIQEAKEAIRS
jgi:adenylosuccinate lyase